MAIRKPNLYLGMQTRFLWRILRRRKLSAAKIGNVLHCYLAYFLRRERSGRSPFMINFDLCNECNESCVMCRSERGQICDVNPRSSGEPILKGQMPLQLYKEILLQVKDWLLLSIPYINGEPLLYKDLDEVIRFTSQHRVATMISSNGLLLNAAKSQQLLEAGLDFLKIHISGFTTPVHRIEHRRGDVEKVKENIARLAELNARAGAGMLVILDYILYNHNRHELEAAREFARQHGLMFNVRPGNPRGLEASEPLQVSGPLPTGIPCVFLWTALSVNWDGSLLPCCDYVVWSGQRPYALAACGQTDILGLWNGPEARAMRHEHAVHGRGGIPICAECPRRGIAFKF